MKIRSEAYPETIIPCDHDIRLGDCCPRGSQLRPHIVWFGEEVPKMMEAMAITHSADMLLIIGTSMVVYPAASLIHYIKDDIPVYCVDPNIPEVPSNLNFTAIEKKATEGMDELYSLLNKFK